MSLSMAQSLSEERERQDARHGFTLLARDYYAPVYRFIARQAPNAADAADVTQETFIRAYRSFSRYDPEKPFAPWIYTIARRCVADFYRKRGGNEAVLHDSVEDPQPDPRETADRKDGADSIWEVAAALKPKLHQVLLLHYKENFPLPETARIMGITHTHAKVLLFRARGALKQRLESNPLNGGHLS